jgi:hypothetical protein
LARYFKYKTPEDLGRDALGRGMAVRLARDLSGKEVYGPIRK